jgi:hypothetical protein
MTSAVRLFCCQAHSRCYAERCFRALRFAEPCCAPRVSTFWRSWAIGAAVSSQSAGQTL